jgi:hypothetical protein
MPAVFLHPLWNWGAEVANRPGLFPTIWSPYWDWFPLLPRDVVCPFRTAVRLKQKGQHPTIEKTYLEKCDPSILVSGFGSITGMVSMTTPGSPVGAGTPRLIRAIVLN